MWQAKELKKPGLPPILRDSSFEAFKYSDTSTSRFQRDVVAILRSLGFKLEEEFRAHSGYSIDALVYIKGEKIGVEVDGPTHFIGKDPKGHTLLKRRQVLAIDKIRVVSVPYWEWDGLQDEINKKDYLMSLLHKV